MWAKLDDRFCDHPKVEQLSDKAFRGYVRSICYAAGVLSDGFVPGGNARRWISVKAIGELLAAGLWTQVPKGYAIHDYLEYQPSREAVLAKRSSDSERKRSGFPAGSNGTPLVGRGGVEVGESAFSQRLVENDQRRRR